MALVFFWACATDPTAFQNPSKFLTPRFSVSGPLGSHNITIPADNGPGSEVVNEATGIYLPDNSTVFIKVTGSVTLGSYPAAHGYGGTSAFGDQSYVGRSIGPLGVSTGGAEIALQVKVRMAGQPNPYSLSIIGGDSSVGGVTVHVGQGGYLLVSRTSIVATYGCNNNAQPPQCLCAGAPCTSFSIPSYTFSGTQTLTVDRLDDDVTLTAVQSFGLKGRSVTFTPHSSGGYATTWAWTPDSGSAQTVACAYLSGSCTTNVYESGWMDVTYVVSAHDTVPTMTRHAKAHVSVVDCPVGDSIADDPTVRKALLSALIASNPDSTPGFGFRHEEGGNIWKLSDGTYVTTPFANPNATECRIDFDVNPTPPQAGATRVAMFHTHPGYDGDDVYGCPPDADGKPYAQYFGDGKRVPMDYPSQNGGGSKEDWTVAADGMDQYIISKDGSVYRLSSSNQPDPYYNNPDRWTSHLSAGCWEHQF